MQWPLSGNIKLATVYICTYSAILKLTASIRPHLNSMWNCRNTNFWIILCPDNLCLDNARFDNALTSISRLLLSTWWWCGNIFAETWCGNISSSPQHVVMMRKHFFPVATLCPPLVCYNVATCPTSLNLLLYSHFQLPLRNPQFADNFTQHISLCSPTYYLHDVAL